MKTTLILFLLLLITKSFLLAQKVKTDSTSIKTKIAVSDAKHFRLNKQLWQANKKNGFDPTSDHFKPATTNTTHPEWLTDSVYVKAYRIAAFKKNIRRRTTGHYFLVGGGIYAGAIVIGTVVMVAGLALGFIKFP
ncbi:MAG: hypothetical protein EOP43_04225 [Sphingobacteriaceae bacterium]|nr:MAG: hypothetical protein EOP43_04225 [Sphingobacteriaceae bacterium]